MKQKVADIKKDLPDFNPGLCIVQVGGREDSNVYIRMKIKAAKEIGIETQHLQLPRTTTEIELLDKVSSKQLCNANSVNIWHEALCFYVCE